MIVFRPERPLIGWLLRRAPLAAAFLLGGGLLAGCAEGPYQQVRSWTPGYRQQLAQERQYGPTFPEKLAELQGLRARGASLPLVEQEKICQELVEIKRASTNPLLRREITRTLGFFASNAAADGLQAAISDADRDVRVEACEAWGRYGGPAALTALAEALGSDVEVDVRIAAARELSQFRDPVAARALAVALDDTDPALRFRAIESLKQVTGRDLGADVDAWRYLVAHGAPPPGSTPSMAERLRRWLF